MASYPSNIKTFPTLVDMVDSVLAAHQNERGDEITAIETELGTNPKGSAASVKARIEAIETELGTNPKGSAASVKARIEAIEAQFAITAGKVLTLSKNLTSQGGDGTLVFPSSGATLTIPASTGLREILTANRTYYVRTDGDDSHTGLVDSAAGAFKTIQKAVDTIANTLDIAGKTVTIQVGDGTYTGTVTLKNVIGYASVGNLVIQGNSGTPANVVISTTTTCITANGISSVWRVKDMKLTSSADWNGCLWAINSTIYFSNVDFGSAHFVQVLIGGCSASIVCDGNYTISGDSQYHWYIEQGAGDVAAITVTLSGTRTFTGSFILCRKTGTFTQKASTTYSGSATGKRYAVALNGVIDSGGVAFPGDVDGTKETGGQYV